MAPLEEVSFAISYRPREVSGAAAKDAVAPSETPLAARESVIHMGADAMQRALSARGVRWAVDLQFPQVVLVLEVLPVKAPSAAEAGKTLTGLAVVPGGLCVIKPRLQCRGTGKGG
ncbi:hypothetical protein H632_c4348p1 [Helicosporidium sp. ATCC 50920]|nr:hypothetical protein H632_c4348p1 [Helicosporidium sp. ATCC 50920]|eukprot:KDD71818.1 hypothetical protein H632_c4348p1 [Helicosporidium sp. ATCC 50920]